MLHEYQYNLDVIVSYFTVIKSQWDQIIHEVEYLKTCKIYNKIFVWILLQCKLVFSIELDNII
jgi:hypothetical protein